VAGKRRRASLRADPAARDAAGVARPHGRWRGPGRQPRALNLPTPPCPRTGGRGEGKGEGIDYQAARGVECQRCITWLMVPYTGTLRVVAQGTHKRTVMRRWRASPQGETPRAEFFWEGCGRKRKWAQSPVMWQSGRQGRMKKPRSGPPTEGRETIGDGAAAGCGARWRPRAGGGSRPRDKRLPRARRPSACARVITGCALAADVWRG
jgi:hypothetical protein